MMNISNSAETDMLLSHGNLSLGTSEAEEVTMRLTHYFVPATFGLIFSLGLLGNFMVIAVVSQ